jgi:hypothetical protein
MRIAVAATALGLTLFAAAGLAACTPQDPGEIPDPGPSRTPVFASEEEALAAAEELYGEYQNAANALGQSGWADPSALEEFVRGDALEDELSGAETSHDLGYTQVGSATFDSFALQQIDDQGTGALLITAYLCADVGDVDVVDSSGLSIVSPTRPDRQPLEIDIDDQDGGLKISRSEAWTGQDFC